MKILRQMKILNQNRNSTKNILALEKNNIFLLRGSSEFLYRVSALPSINFVNTSFVQMP